MNQNEKRHLVGPFGVAVITLTMSLLLMSVYVHRNLMGNFDYHMLTAKMFGIPQPLRDRGLDEFYLGRTETGWDGQFYYFMANDLLGSPDTARHLDNPGYRYQRIGLPLLAKGLSIVTGGAWVSPKTYYATSLILICLASYFLARFFSASGLSPLWALTWSLGIGTQLTSINGLPDAAADALLILALAALLGNRLRIYSLAMALSSLSREAYLIFPLMIGLALVVDDVMERRSAGLVWMNPRQFFAKPILHAQVVPVVICVLWQAYVRIHFSSISGVQIDGILAAPFGNWARYLWSALHGKHLLIPGAEAAVRESILLMLFAALLAIAAYQVVRFAKLKGMQPAERGVVWAAGALVTMYCCFGPIVMMHYTGYLKAAHVFLILIPLIALAAGAGVGVYVRAFLLVYSMLAFGFFIQDRFMHPAYFSYYTSGGDITDATVRACVKVPPKVRITFVGFEVLRPGGPIGRLVHPATQAVRVRVENLSDMTLHSSTAHGSFSVGARILRSTRGTNVVASREIHRTSFAAPLEPGADVIIPLMYNPPSEKGQFTLVISLVQEQCGWLYESDPSGSLQMSLSIR